ncbi:MAG: hypothetical protein QNK37_29080 [Acidobacteriota bacterium]|nr:hypothetical protein [Acidobacteriota bacterium]
MIYRFFSLSRDEALPLLRLLMFGLGISIFSTHFVCSALTGLLAHHADHLPLGYLALGIISLFSLPIMNRMKAMHSSRKSGTLWCLLGIFLILQIVLASELEGLSIALLMFALVAPVLGLVHTAYAGLAMRFFSEKQGMRLQFAVEGGLLLAQALGLIIFYLSITDPFLHRATAFLGLFLAALFPGLKSLPGEEPRKPKPAPETMHEMPLTSGKMIVALTLLVASGILAAMFCDFLFLYQIANIQADPFHIATFIAAFFCIGKIGELFFKIITTRPSGYVNSNTNLLLLPLALLPPALLSAWIAESNPFSLYLFVLAMIARMVFICLNINFYNPGLVTLKRYLGGTTRIVPDIIRPLTLVTAGALFQLIYSYPEARRVFYTSIMFAVITAVWLVLIVRLNFLYRKTIRENPAHTKNFDRNTAPWIGLLIPLSENKHVCIRQDDQVLWLDESQDDMMVAHLQPYSHATGGKTYRKISLDVSLGNQTTQLARLDNDVINHIDQGFNSYPFHTRCIILRLFARNFRPRTRNLLIKKLTLRQREIVWWAAHLLSRPGFEPTTKEKEIIEEALRESAVNLVRLAAVRADLTWLPANYAVHGALEWETECEYHTLFTLLSWLTDAKVVDTIRISDQNKASNRSHINDLIRQHLPADLVEFLGPLLRRGGPSQTVRQYYYLLPQETLEPTARLLDLLALDPGHITGWTKACAARALAVLAGDEIAEVLPMWRIEEGPLVKETLAWCARVLDPKSYTSYISERRDPVVRKLNQEVREAVAGRRLLIWDKAQILRRVVNFSKIPHSILARVAAHVSERNLETGEFLVSRRKPVQALYLFYEGDLSISRGPGVSEPCPLPSLIGSTGSFETGEWAVTVKADSPSRILVLNHDAMNELYTYFKPIMAGTVRITPSQRDSIFIDGTTYPAPA